MKDDFKVIYKSKFKKDGYFYDEVYQVENTTEGRKKKYGFIKYIDDYSNDDKEKWEFIEYLEFEENGVKYRVLPAHYIASQKTDILFDDKLVQNISIPPMPLEDEYESDFALYQEIRAFIHKYVELKSEYEKLLTIYVMKASLFHYLNTSSFPMIHIIAPLGKGKSRLLQTLTLITPYGLYVVNIHSASVKRLSEVYSPVLYVDEQTHMDDDLISILNARYNIFSTYYNADNNIQRGANSIISYRLFGPTVIVSRTPFKDDALESKSYQIDMNFELTRDDVPRNLKGYDLDIFEDEAERIRRKLMRFRIKNIERINSVQPSNFIQQYERFVEPRLYELLSFFDDMIALIPELKDEIADVLESIIKKNVEVMSNTPNGIVATTFLSILDNAKEEDFILYTSGGKQYTGIYLASIYEVLGENYANQTGKILSALGLITDRVKKTYTDENGKQKHKLVRVVRVPDEKKIKELRSRYDIEYIENVLSALRTGVINSGIQRIQRIQDMETRAIGIQHIQDDILLYKSGEISNNIYNNTKVSNNNNIQNLLNSNNGNNNINENDIGRSKLSDTSDTSDTKNEWNEERIRKFFTPARLEKWYYFYKHKLENADIVVRERRNIERLIADDYGIPIEVSKYIVDEWLKRGLVSQSGNVIEFRGGN